MTKLTDHQRKILMMTVAGQNSAEVGARLGITASTVRNTLSQTYRKLGVRGRMGAAIWAASVGLVEVEPRVKGGNNG